MLALSIVPHLGKYWPYIMYITCIQQEHLQYFVKAAPTLPKSTTSTPSRLKISSTYWLIQGRTYLSNKVYYNLTIHFNSLRLRQNGRHFADDILKCIFFNENIYKFQLKFHWCLFLRFELTNSSNGSDNGLAPTRWATSHYLDQR